MCVRDLAVDRIDEECNPRFIEMIDQTARRRAEEQEAQKLIEQKRRFEKIDRDVRDLQERKKRLRREIEDLEAQCASAPSVLKLDWIERHENTLMTLIYFLLILSIKPLITGDIIIFGSLVVFALISWAKLHRVKVRAQMKNAHNITLQKRTREISNLKFDLETLEAQKIRLPANLSEFINTNPGRADERGFEPAAQADGRRKV